MGNYLKKGVIVAIVAFVAFFVITRPLESADAVRVFWGGIEDAFWAVFNFFARLGR